MHIFINVKCFKCISVAFQMFTETNNTTSTGSGSSGPSVGGPGKNNGCPVFDTSCAPGCAQIDAMGCLHCTCTGIQPFKFNLFFFFSD